MSQQILDLIINRKYDEETLIKEVSVVFHSAATIKFDEELTK